MTIAIGGLCKVEFDGVDVVGILAHAAGLDMLEVGGSINVVTFHIDDIKSYSGSTLMLFPASKRKHDVVGDHGCDNVQVYTKGII